MSQARCPASGSQAVLPRTSQPERRQAALPSMKVLEKLVTMQSSGCGRLPLLPSLPDSSKTGRLALPPHRASGVADVLLRPTSP
ncbi:hypothetical protein F441_09010 [Phytophthora nicotianae CJ01A1]|uniref:Uncharacterized protein n=1 Tax=Phytophthora nicotianae CJ01A1 TaxID=1317063 RepID=W2X1E0_PHYNI|nr:hypothetical protein F441_09010 [Phytophthora nicotianae CJ01A1]